MFEYPFSFDGRIRRTEYGLSFLVYLGVSISIRLIILSQKGMAGLTVLFIPILWFIWAQGAKRCHDIGRNGWYQLIPFYFLYLIFEDGEVAENEYGDNPKGIDNYDQPTHDQ